SPRRDAKVTARAGGVLLFSFEPGGIVGEGWIARAQLDQHAMRGARGNEGLETRWRPLGFIDDSHALLLERGGFGFAVGNVERQMMHPFAALFEELVQERIGAERVQELDREPAEIELGELEAGRFVGAFVHQARAENILKKLARRGDALNRDADMVEFADRWISHRPSLQID